MHGRRIYRLVHEAFAQMGLALRNPIPYAERLGLNPAFWCVCLYVCTDGWIFDALFMYVPTSIYAQGVPALVCRAASGGGRVAGGAAGGASSGGRRSRVGASWDWR